MNEKYKPGDAFNPHRMFNGLFIPEQIARLKGLRPGPKLAWGRLARYAGEDGQCYPSMKTLAEEIGVSARQAQRYVVELERMNLVRRISRFKDGSQTSNGFEFVWHELFELATDMSGGSMTDMSPPPVSDSSPKESHLEESHSEVQKRDLDLDSLPRSRKKRALATGELPSSNCREYPRLRDALADYMQSMPEAPREYPPARIVVEIIDASNATEAEVIQALQYLLNERGLKPFTKNGPRHFSWFPTVLQDHFEKKRTRDRVVNPVGRDELNDWSEAGSVQ